MNYRGALALVALLPCNGAAAAGVPQATDIAKLEAVAKVPADTGRTAVSLAKYQRYYALIVIHGRQMIRGEFVLPYDQDRKPGIFPVGRTQDFPGIADGGCSVVNVLYDIAAEQILYIRCNGYA